ncbi:MAG TPA: hypothetical protein VFU69_01775 [Ktedonobacterales bacterium]|nr:hypothetical protein [Ktedonobacterales bacterium]
MLTSAAVSQTPLPNLYISLVFGVGQVVVGAAMIVYTAHRQRWRQMTFFVLALLAAWLAASGLTEIVVSGTELLARLGGSLSAATAQQVRARADAAFFDASVILIALGAVYLLVARRWLTPRKPGEARANAGDGSSASDGREADQEQTAKAPSAENDG